MAEEKAEMSEAQSMSPYLKALLILVLVQYYSCSKKYKFLTSKKQN